MPISAFPHKRDYKAVTVTTSMDQLIEAAMNQNFVPVVDDRGIFIGIVRRQAIIRYCYEKARRAAGRSPAVWCRNTPPPIERRKTIGGHAALPFLGGWSIFAKIPGKALKVRFMGCRMCDNTAMGATGSRNRVLKGRQTDRTKQEGNTMKDFEMRYVGSHVEVYTGSGVFLFSADTGAGGDGGAGRVGPWTLKQLM